MIFFKFLISLFLNGISAQWNTINQLPTRIIGHRGERAFSLPEHSLPAYHLSIFEHADFIEPDLVMTRDGILVCYHDIGLKFNTDIEEKVEYANRKRNITISDPDGSEKGSISLIEDWIVSDFTFAELSSLRLKVQNAGPINMRLPWFDNNFRIPSFQEYLDLISYFSIQLDRKIGIIPELKHAKWHNSLFFFRTQNHHYFEDVFLAQLVRNSYHLHGANEDKGPIIIQNFEEESARYIRSRSDFYILQLVYRNVQHLTPKGLDRVKEYANGIGAFKEFYSVGVESVIKYSQMTFKPDFFKYINSLGGFISSDTLSKEIKLRNLEQIGYTFYSSYEPSKFLCLREQGCPPIQDRREELFYYFDQGLEGIFVENIAEAILLREEYNARFAQSSNPTESPSLTMSSPASDDVEEPSIFEFPPLERMIPSLDITPYYSWVGFRSLLLAPFITGFFTGIGEGLAYLGLARYFSVSFITLAFQKPVN